MDKAGQAVRVETCGCSSRDMRRVCDQCDAAQGAFAACSLACLNKHLAATHALAAPFDSGARAVSYLTRVNQQLAGSWQRYHEHRERVMALVTGAGGGDIAIFGAGNASDLNLTQLAFVFQEIHLIDLDGEALERARQALPSGMQKQVILHAPVDLCGFMGRLDDWGERLPDEATLGPAAVAAAWGIIQSLVQKRGRGFDVVLSAGVLSQLIVPFRRAWIATRVNWARLAGAVTALHLATLAGSTRSGGTGVLAFDVLSSKDVPGLGALVGRGASELEAYVRREAAGGAISLQPDPDTLIKQLQSPSLRALVQDPRLTAPWLWDLGDAVQLVYGLQFRRS